MSRLPERARVSQTESQGAIRPKSERLSQKESQSEPERAKVSIGDKGVAKVSQSEPERARVSKSKPKK